MAKPPQQEIDGRNISNAVASAMGSMGKNLKGRSESTGSTMIPNTPEGLIEYLRSLGWSEREIRRQVLLQFPGFVYPTNESASHGGIYTSPEKSWMYPKGSPHIPLRNPDSYYGWEPGGSSRANALANRESMWEMPYGKTSTYLSEAARNAWNAYRTAERNKWVQENPPFGPSYPGAGNDTEWESRYNLFLAGLDRQRSQFLNDWYSRIAQEHPEYGLTRPALPIAYRQGPSSPGSTGPGVLVPGPTTTPITNPGPATGGSGNRWRKRF